MRHMSQSSAEHVRQVCDDLYRTESRRVLATLIRLLGDFDLAEDALHDAFRAALEQWERDGVPARLRSPYSGLTWTCSRQLRTCTPKLSQCNVALGLAYDIYRF